MVLKAVGIGLGGKKENSMCFRFLVFDDFLFREDEYDWAHPRDNDEHTAGDVDGDQVIRELPLEYKLNLQTAVFAWKFIIVLCCIHLGKCNFHNRHIFVLLAPQ